jgi:hypothetical protein
MTLGEGFQMCIILGNNGTGVAAASKLTVVESSSDESVSNTWLLNVPQLAPGAVSGTSPSEPASCVPATLSLNSGVTYDFNCYDPTGNWLYDAIYEM